MALTQGQFYSLNAGSLMWILLLNPCIASASFVSVFRFWTQPDKVIHSHIGHNLTMEWSFAKTNKKIFLNHDKGQRDREFLFGEWNSPGYVSRKVLLVRGSVIMTKTSYETKVNYKGNLSNLCTSCTAKITFFNLTHEDFNKTYGVSVFIYPYVHPLQSSLKIERYVPARIKSWPKNIEAQEGEELKIPCHVEGKPSPSVEIVRNGEVVKKGIGVTEFTIPSVKANHAGEYHCVAYPKDKAQSLIRKTMKLDVRLKATTKPSTVVTVTSAAKWTTAFYHVLLVCLVISSNAV